ncbi:MAG: hypothetical protein ACLR8P_11160 [Clostridium fessum]
MRRLERCAGRSGAASWEEFPPSQKWFAVGECMAHLDYLRLRGRDPPGDGRRSVEMVHGNG